MDREVADRSLAERAAGGSARYDLIHADALREFPELVRMHGGRPEQLMQAARIGAASRGPSNGSLDYGAFVELMNLAAEHSRQSDFGLQLAERQRGGRVIGPIGVVMKNSETVGKALGYCAKHIHAYSLATRVRFQPDRANHRLFVKLELLLDSVVDTRQVVEHALALAAFNVRDISAGNARAKQVSFRHPPLQSVRRYAETFGCEVVFGQPNDGLVFSEADLLCPVLERDDQIYEMATSFIDQRFQSRAAPVHTSVRVLILKYLASDACSIERIASDLCLHPRTLQRRLRAEQRSFEGIRDEVRRELALRYLRQGDIPLTVVAEKLGYAETSVLSRSCFRWFEASPQQLRRRAVTRSAVAA